MTDSAKQVTALAAQVADLNHRISTYRGQDQQPNDLLDQRDELIAQIGEYIDITTVAAPDGTMSVFAAGGQRLVLGAEAASLTVSPSAADASRVSLSISSNGVSIELSDDMLTGGSMSGLLKFQNEDLVSARNQLGQMAAAFASKVNEAQHMGVDLNGDTGGDLSDIFKLGPAQALPSANNARDGSGNLLAQVGITRTDASLLQASDYTLRPDPGNPGQYTVTRESDGEVFGPLSPDVDGNLTMVPDQGFSVQIGNPPPQPGDSFLLQPVGRAASGMSRALDDPDGLAAALPVEATLGANNTGTASVDLLRMTDGSVDPDLSATITFGAGGTYSYELRDSSGTLVGSGGPLPYEAGDEISLNGFALTLNGVPAEGDTLTIDKTDHPATNNGNALSLSRLADERFVGQSIAGDGSRLSGATVTDAYADTMSNIGVRVQSAGVASNISIAASNQAGQTLANKTGVNLDEEAARLIQFQQGYQAAAKVLQVAQSVFDTMLQIGR
jgi:flagellar hook-associated protein 1 FlgK